MANRSVLRGLSLCGSALAALTFGVLVSASNAANRARPTGDVTWGRLLRADAEPGNWFTGGRDYQQSYYSPLADIKRENVGQLGFAWSYDVTFSAPFQATPIVVDGVMFTSGNRGNVYALDAATGNPRWSFEPRIDKEVLRIDKEFFRKLCCGEVNRGVAVWRGKVYVGSIDGYLYALDAVTGAVAWKVDTIIDRSRSYSVTGSPYIAKGQVVIGNAGAEFDARGYITAYHTETGKQTWRFFTVPGDPAKGFEHPELKLAAATWDANSLWESGLGGTVWDGMAYDPTLNLLYVGTGNGAPWNRNLRSPRGGDNLFLSSILAINPDSGRLVWHYQTTPGDSWDYTATQKLILADLKLDGKRRQVVMQAPKNGFFYVLDRATGELLSAKPYIYVNWASHVDMATGRPVETGRADYSRGPTLVFPTEQGGHNWYPMSYNPRTGLVYIPTLEAGRIFGARGPYTPDALRRNEPDPRPRTFLRAWDPVGQKMAWQVETTEPDQGPVYFRRLAGVMTTAADLVFQGQIDGRLRVFDARTGKQLREIDVGTSMIAAPMTYAVDGKQFVAIMAGVSETPAYVDYKYGNRGRIVAFRLGGGEVPKHSLVDRSKDRLSMPPPVSDSSAPSEVEAGAQLFEQHCALCHANAARAPDLTRMDAEDHRQFTEIVLKGSRVDKGMGNFGNVLTARQAGAIHSYIIASSWENYRRAKANEALHMLHP